MLPGGNMSDIMYPMTADIYYSTETQNDIGSMISAWTKDKTIKCSAIKERPSSAIANAIESQKFLDFDPKLDFRTDNDILLSTDGTRYMLTEIIITNIKDPSGRKIWVENSGDSTEFELGNIEPMFDPLHNFFGFRVLLIRSEEQDNVQH
jgi:hypothetical protein